MHNHSIHNITDKKQTIKKLTKYSQPYFNKGVDITHYQHSDKQLPISQEEHSGISVPISVGKELYHHRHHHHHHNNIRFQQSNNMNLKKLIILLVYKQNT